MPCLSKLWSWEQSDEEETIVLPPQHPIEEIDLQLDPQQESIENLMDENFTDIEDKGDKCNMIAGFCITHNRDIKDCVHLYIYKVGAFFDLGNRTPPRPLALEG